MKNLIILALFLFCSFLALLSPLAGVLGLSFLFLAGVVVSDMSKGE